MDQIPEPTHAGLGARTSDAPPIDTNAIYRGVFEHMAEGLAYCRMIVEGGEPVDWVYLAVNPAFETLTGLSNVAGKRVSEVIPGLRQADPELFAIYARVAASRAPHRFNWFAAARHRWYSVSAFSPAPGDFVAVFDEVTERKQTEASLLQEREAVERYFGLSLDLLCIADMAGHFVRVNPEWEASLGYAAEELTGRSFLELIHPDDVPATRAAMSALAAHEDVRSFINRYRHQDGSYRWIEWRSRAQGGLIYAAARDITSRREQEQALRASEARLRAILEHSQDAIGVHVGGVWRMCNPSAVQLFGVSGPEDLIGTPIVEVIAVSERARIAEFATRRASAADGPLNYVTRGLRRDGTEFPMEVTVSVYTLDNARHTLVILRDVTEREYYERALRDSERQLAEAQGLTAVGSWTVTLDGDEAVWTASRELYRIWGYPPGTRLTTEKSFDRVHPDDRARVADEWASVLGGDGHTEHEFRIVVDGIVKWVHVHAKAERGPRGRVRLVTGTNQDITSRKDAEERLKASEAKYRLLFEHMQEGCSLNEVITEPDGRVSDFRILEMNPAYERHSGLKRLDAIGRTIREVMPSVDSGQIEVYGRVALTAEPLTFEYQSKTFERWFRVVAFSPSPGRFATVFEDITELKRAEGILTRRHAILEAVRFAAEQFLRTPEWQTVTAPVLARLGEAADVSRVVIFECGFESPGDVLLSWRAEWAAPGIEPRVEGPRLQNLPLRAMGFERWIHELGEGRAVAGLVRDLPDAEQPALLAQGIRSVAAMPIVVDDHWWGFIGFDHCVVESAWTDGQIEALRVAARVVGSAIERRQAETTRQQLEARLLQKQKLESIGQLAGGVAHDFNNMLQVIEGRAAMALAAAGAADPIRSHLFEIEKAARHSASLTRQLLAFARKQAVTPQVLDLNETVAQSLTMIRRIIGEHIEVVWTPCPDLPLIRMDPVQVEQILANLCANARDAIVGGGRLDIATGVDARGDGAPETGRAGAVVRWVTLTVADSGVGMSAEILEHIFEPFFTTKDVGHGTGLGLATVYGIARQNGGDVRVSSDPDVGTTFTISLPSETGGAAGARSQTAAASAVGRQQTVLLVEDEPAVLELVAMQLEDAGYRVLIANSPHEALRLAQAHGGDIQLLLTDVVMPGMNGTELYSGIKAMRPAIHVLFMSGYTADLIGNGADQGTAVIQKPFSARDLAEKVHRLLTS